MADPIVSPETAQGLMDRGLIDQGTYQRFVPQQAPAVKDATASAGFDAVPGAMAPMAPQSSDMDEIIATGRKAQADKQQIAAARDAEENTASYVNYKSHLDEQIKQDMAAGVPEEGIRAKYASDFQNLETMKLKAGAGNPSIQNASYNPGTNPVTPTNVSLASDQPTLTMPGTPQEGVQTPGVNMGGLLQGYDIQQAAIAQQAEAGAAKASETAAYFDRAAKDDEKRIKTQEATYAERQTRLDKEYAKLDEASTRLGALEVNPDRYWANKSTGDKVMAGIGLFLGAFGAGGNKAAPIIVDAINRDIDAQKANITTQKDSVTARRGLLNEMQSIFKDRDAAEAATRKAYLENALVKVKQIEAKYTAPEVKAKAAQLIGELETKKAEATVKFQTAIQKMNPPSVTATADINKMDKDTRERFVPGYGLARTKEDATKIIEINSEGTGAKNNIDRLLQINKIGGKSFDTNLRAEADNIQKNLIGQLRVAMTGPGAMSEGERELIESVIANPTSFFNRDATNETKLRTLRKIIDNKFKASLKAYGIQTPADKLGIKEASN